MRKEYIRKQKEQYGRKCVAVLPILYPKEILTAMDILAVEMWGPPGPPRGADAGRIQTYVCAVARNALAFMASGGADIADGVLFPHTCDSIQQLGSLAPDFGGWSKPAFTFLHPKGEKRASSAAFVEKEMRSLAKDLEKLTGAPLAEDRLRAAIELHREIDKTRSELIARRARLDMDDKAFYTLLRRGEYLWPEEHLKELREAKAAISSRVVQKGLPIMVTGYVPEPMSIFSAINGAGAFVAADDYAAVGRRLYRNGVSPDGDPFAALATMYFRYPPCPTRAADQSIRMKYLSELFDQSGAVGVVIHEIKFCEPELFDIAGIRKTFADKKAPLLYLEGELESELSSQSVTRIEAFVEMIASGRNA